jgi:hypothetical protein
VTYPPEVRLSEEAEQKLKMQLIIDITNHRSERSAWIDELRKQQKDYWASPKTETKTFPFRGAANLVIPLTAIVAEAVHARMMQRIFSQDHITAAKFSDGTWSAYDRAIERCLDWQLITQLRFRDRIEDAMLECVKFGTGIVKNGYKRVTKNVEIDGELTETIQYAGPWFEAVPLVNFLMPFAAQDPQTAPWCGEEHRSTEYDVLLAERAGLFRKGSYEKLTSYYGSVYASNLSSESYVQDTQREQKQEPAFPQEIGWYEIYRSVDFNSPDPLNPEANISKSKEVVILYHFDSNTILSIRDNWEEGRRPYEIGQYIKVEHRWAGIGVAKQNDQFQREVTMQHRQRLDAGSLANANMIKVKKLSNISPNEPVFPGKMWFVDEMDEIETFQLGGTYPAASNNEQQTLYYAQQRSGINELTLGMPQVGTPGTATSDMARVQESGIKFDYNYNNIRSLLSRVITNVVCDISRFGLSDPRYYDIVPEGPILRQFFSLPANLHRAGIICTFEVVGQTANKMLDRQNWQTVQQAMTAYYQNAIAVAQVMGNPQLMMAIGLQSINASTLAFKHMLESFDIPNSNKLTLEALINGLLPAIQGPSGSGANQGPVEGIGAPPGISGPPQIIGSSAIAGTPVAG